MAHKVHAQETAVVQTGKIQTFLAGMASGGPAYADADGGDTKGKGNIAIGGAAA